MIICAHIFCAQEDFRILAKRQVSLVNMSATDSRLTSQKILKILIKKRNYDNHGLFLNWIELEYLSIWNIWIFEIRWRDSNMNGSSDASTSHLQYLLRLLKTVSFCFFLILILIAYATLQNSFCFLSKPYSCSYDFSLVSWSRFHNIYPVKW